ncbi:tetratricopeptide repeat protein [Pseudodesulfovibrio karagichevae]|uniref:Tol-pal system YbgF family protein n=1 Tax=Pseudodesulfovibrio karagichevae TaxID=3239305 RepID=A0ABV4JYI9_9BACT
MKQTNAISRRLGTKSRFSALFSLLAALLLAGCVGSSLGVGVGVGTGGGGVGVGVGAGTTSVGVGAGGFGVSLNSTGDFLNNGPNEAYLNNKAGIKQLNDGNFEAARKIFTDTLEKYPDLPDSTYYLGLTLIYLGQREAGFGLLKTYREPLFYRATSAVQRMAAYLEKKPELTAEEIHKAMNRERRDGFDRDLRERRELQYGL